MTKATYSVIIPTYNRQSFLLRALKSVEKQIIKPKEVFIVDNHPFGINKFIFDKCAYKLFFTDSNPEAEAIASISVFISVKFEA